MGYQKEKALSTKLTPDDFLNLVSEDLLSSMTNGKQETLENAVNQAKNDLLTRDLFLMFEMFKEIKKVDQLKDPLNKWINLHQDWIV